MRLISKLILTSVLYVSFIATAHEDGLINVKSNHNVKKTADRLEAKLQAKGITIFTRINHTEGAKKVGEKLKDTEVVIFGNPKIGTPLMQCSLTMAIDLPQKALIWEDEKGNTWLTYNDPKYLAKRHSIKECNGVLNKIGNVLNKFSAAATAAE